MLRPARTIPELARACALFLSLASEVRRESARISAGGHSPSAGRLADPELPHQAAQTLGNVAHPLGAGGQPAEGAAHLAGGQLDAANGLAVVQAALVERLDDLEHALHPCMQQLVLGAFRL